jgi:hypothetical protein
MGAETSSDSDSDSDVEVGEEEAAVDAETDAQWCRILEKGYCDLLQQGAAWAEIARKQQCLPRYALLYESVRAHLQSIGFDSLPALRAVVRSHALMIGCGHIPPGWNTRICGPSYRPRVLWYDSCGRHRLTVAYYPEPWRRLAHLRIEDSPSVGSIWECGTF